MPVTLKNIWREFAPSGTIDITTDFAWVTGSPVDVRLPRLELTNGAIMLRSLPYRLDGVKGSFTYGPDDQARPKLNIASFTGQHGKCAFAVKGYQRSGANGDWLAHFDEFKVDKLTPNVEFLKTLAGMPALQQFFANLDPDQTLSMDGVMELKQTQRPGGPIVTAACSPCIAPTANATCKAKSSAR